MWYNVIVNQKENLSLSIYIHWRNPVLQICKYLLYERAEDFCCPACPKANSCQAGLVCTFGIRSKLQSKRQKHNATMYFSRFGNKFQPKTFLLCWKHKIVADLFYLYVELRKQKIEQFFQIISQLVRPEVGWNLLNYVKLWCPRSLKWKFHETEFQQEWTRWRTLIQSKQLPPNLLKVSDNKDRGKIQA